MADIFILTVPSFSGAVSCVCVGTFCTWFLQLALALFELLYRRFCFVRLRRHEAELLEAMTMVHGPGKNGRMHPRHLCIAYHGLEERR